MPSSDMEKSSIGKADGMANKENEGGVSTPVMETKKPTAAKHEKAILHEFEAIVKEIRSQLTEQLKAVGERTDTQVAVLGELEDFFKKKGDLEAEHAKQLEKLAKGIMQRHKTEKNRRESWTQHTACTAWQQMVDDTREEAQHKQALADLYQKVMSSSISSRCDDLVRISKKCREIGSLSHNELNRVLTELHTAMKTYQLCHSELSGVERKLRAAEDDKRRYDEANPGKSPTARKARSLAKYLSKRSEKYEMVRAKCTKGRNEYLMCVRAANAALHRFFAEDLSYLIDCMDLGMDFWMKSLLDQVIEMRKRVTQREMDSLAELGTLRSGIDSKADKQRFFESHHATFMLPKQFEFRAQLGDTVSTVSAEKGIAMELGQRQKQIQKRLDNLRFESDEVWKTLEASERQLHKLYTTTQNDMSKWRANVLETYQYYLSKFELFLLNGNLIDRLEARSRTIGEALVREGGLHRDSIPALGEERSKRKIRRIGAAPENTAPRPRLFGGSLDEYVEVTGEQIPMVVTSSIGYLSRFSLRNQGLFRVSGSQSEINRFRDAYERGEDAFSDLTDSSESNSVAGVLKLYLRELREPLFPIFLFDQFTDCAKAETPQEFVRRAQDLIWKLPLSHVLLLRFLFAFLSHLCEFADENMMEPHSMAICFGPTLLPIPEGKDQVFYHNYVNELVRNLIIHSFDVFPSTSEMGGPVYDKFSIDVEPEHLGYMDEGDAMSDDEDCLRNGTSSGDVMLDSTYDMSMSTDGADLIPPLMIRETTHDTMVDQSIGASPGGDSEAGTATCHSTRPSISSRSSNRSHLDDWTRRTSDDISPVLRSDMPRCIANEITAKFASRDREREKAVSPAARPIWEHERPQSHASSTTSHSSVPSSSSSGPRLPMMTSLRDQLHHHRREQNGRDDMMNGCPKNNAKVHPLPDSVANKPQRLSLHDTGVLDARGTTKTDSRSALCDYTVRLAATSSNECAEARDDIRRVLSEQNYANIHSGMSDVPPDVVASARRSHPSQVDGMARAPSPPIDELVAMLRATDTDC